MYVLCAAVILSPMKQYCEILVHVCMVCVYICWTFLSNRHVYERWLQGIVPAIAVPLGVRGAAAPPQQGFPHSAVVVRHAATLIFWDYSPSPRPSTLLCMLCYCAYVVNEQ